MIWSVIGRFALKYLWEIVAIVAFMSALGLVYWKAQSWCNAACREQKILLQECTLALKHEQASLAKERAVRKDERQFYDKERAEWQAQVNAQEEQIVAIRQANEEIVEKHRKPFSEIFKRNTQNEQKAQIRIRSEVKPSDVVTAPTSLVREYNEAVARAPASQGSGGSQSGLPKDSSGTEGEVATFSALAVGEALIENINRYNRLALKCDALVDIVVDLEARYGANTSGPDGPAVKP